jgi:segregation and condensation protein B
MSQQQDEPEGSINDMELAYREAMRAIDEAEQQVGSALLDLSEDIDASAADEDTSFMSVGSELAEDLASHADDTIAVTSDSTGRRVTPREVVEAALFVGGEVSLTAKKLASLISNDTEPRVAARIIDQLNETYSQQRRPYEIRLREGGFRMELREEYCSLQLRMFGMGPREVRLSPESLEVLAYVAYNQPLTKEDLAQTSQSSHMTLLRQLIRLELVEVERTGSRRSDVVYKTGDRFLKLFGLSSIDDLPQADIFSYK